MSEESDKVIISDPKQLEYPGDSHVIYCIMDKGTNHWKMYKYIKDEYVEIKCVPTEEEERKFKDSCNKYREETEIDRYINEHLHQKEDGYYSFY